MELPQISAIDLVKNKFVSSRVPVQAAKGRHDGAWLGVWGRSPSLILAWEQKGPFFVCPPPQDVLGLDEWQGDIHGNTHNFVGAGKAAKSKRNSPDVLAALRWNINAVLTETFIFRFHRGILFFKAVALKRKAPPRPAGFWLRQSKLPRRALMYRRQPWLPKSIRTVDLAR